MVYLFSLSKNLVNSIAWIILFLNVPFSHFYAWVPKVILYLDNAVCLLVELRGHWLPHVVTFKINAVSLEILVQKLGPFVSWVVYVSSGSKNSFTGVCFDFALICLYSVKSLLRKTYISFSCFATHKMEAIVSINHLCLKDFGKADTNYILNSCCHIIQHSDQNFRFPAFVFCLFTAALLVNLSNTDKFVNFINAVSLVRVNIPSAAFAGVTLKRQVQAIAVIDQQPESAQTHFLYWATLFFMVASTFQLMVVVI